MYSGGDFTSLWQMMTNTVWGRTFLATLAVIAIIYMAHNIGKVAQRVGQAASHSAAIGNLFDMLARVAGYVLALYAGLKILGLDSAAVSVLAGAGVAGLVIGFALQDIAANFISGIILAIQRPFRVGHLVETNEVYGVVKKIHLRSTEVETLDGQLVHIPNKNVLLEVVTDYNYIPYRRVDLSIGVTYGANLDRVKNVTLEAIANLEVSEDNRPIELFFKEFADSSINFDVRFWTAFQHEPDYLEARSQAIIAIQRAYAEAGIEIPFPITTVYDGDQPAMEHKKKRSAVA